MSRVPALLVMHGDLGGALVAAAARLYGPVDDVDVLSNDGLSREALEHEIAGRVAHWREGGLLLTDVWGGSCHMCAALAARGHGDVRVLTGVNVAMLVDYLHNRDAVGVAELAERLVLKGQQSIRVQPGPPR